MGMIDRIIDVFFALYPQIVGAFLGAAIILIVNKLLQKNYHMHTV